MSLTCFGSFVERSYLCLFMIRLPSHYNIRPIGVLLKSLPCLFYESQFASSNSCFASSHASLEQYCGQSQEASEEPSLHSREQLVGCSSPIPGHKEMVHIGPQPRVLETA